MKFKKMILSSLFLGAALCVSAQEKQTEVVDAFNPHWYLQAQIGGQHTLGEIEFGELLSPNAQLGVGYHFNENLGVRMSVNAWQSKAGWNWSPDNYTWKWNYVAPAADLTFNLSNLLLGYKVDRKFNVSWLLGIGANIAFGNDEAQEVNAELHNIYGTNPIDNGENLTHLWDGTKFRLQGRTGVAVDYNYNDRWSMGLEIQANIINDHYKSKKAGNSDWYFNGLLGVKYNLSKPSYKKTVVVPSPRIIERVIERVPAEKPSTAATAAVAQVENIRRDVFFNINCTEISAVEMQKVKEIADYLKKNQRAVVEITSHADKGTGNAKINQKLSENRAKVVAQALIKNYGIAESRIKTAAKGDTVQPFSENELNRVSICIVK